MAGSVRGSPYTCPGMVAIATAWLRSLAAGEPLASAQRRVPL